MHRIVLANLLLFLLTACACDRAAIKLEEGETLMDARSGHVTQLAKTVRDSDTLGEPGSDLFSLVHYSSQVGDLAAWISKPVEAETKQPAMIWITGGFPPGGIDESAWMPAPSDNDQSATSYRESGMVMMYPTLRGCVGNPGQQEGFYGEVDDVIAAADYLRGIDHIDPKRIYLGGHSTGGTLVLLAAAATDKFAGVISFGPVEDPFYYGPSDVMHASSTKEQQLRAPINFLSAITTPTLVIEGIGGNHDSLKALRRRDGGANKNLTFLSVPGKDHFNVLAPANRAIAAKLANHTPGEPIAITADELR